MNTERIRNLDKEFVKQLDLKGIQFLFIKRTKIKEQINISINGFGNKDETCCFYTSKLNFEKHVNQLLLSNSKNLLNVLIKNLQIKQKITVFFASRY